MWKERSKDQDTEENKPGWQYKLWNCLKKEEKQKRKKSKDLKKKLNKQC